MWRHGWPRQRARVSMRALRGCRHGLATRGDADRGPLSRLRWQRRAGERAVPRLSGSRAAPGAGDGTGGHPRHPERATVPVAIPAGVDSGAQIRVAGQGHAGPWGGPRGDLIVIARVHEDPEFTRKGDNLHVEAHITVAEAVLGARVPVRTLEGMAELVVPPGTQSGQVLRLRSRGLPRLTGPGRGDLFVTVRVEIPRGIDARTQELFRELG